MNPGGVVQNKSDRRAARAPSSSLKSGTEQTKCRFGALSFVATRFSPGPRMTLGKESPLVNSLGRVFVCIPGAMTAALDRAIRQVDRSSARRWALALFAVLNRYGDAADYPICDFLENLNAVALADSVERFPDGLL